MGIAGEEILGLGNVADGGLDGLVRFGGGRAFKSIVVTVLSHQRGIVKGFSRRLD